MEDPGGRNMGGNSFRTPRKATSLGQVVVHNVNQAAFLSLIGYPWWENGYGGSFLVPA
jgi:hypothetical protein